MEIIEKLFQMVNDDNIYSNPFETAEVNNTHETFCKKYIYTTKELKDGQNDMWECFVEALAAERKQAFRVGYNTAVKLIFSGGVRKPNRILLQAFKWQK